MNVSVFKGVNFERIKTLNQSEEFNIQIANALRFVIQNAFVNNSNTFAFTIAAAVGPTNNWLYDIMYKLFATCSVMAVHLLMQVPKMERLQVNEHWNMILTDSYRSLKDSKYELYNQNHDSLEYYFIFLKTSDATLIKEMNLIFRFCFHNYWLHCSVMVQTSKGEILVYTYFPFKEHQCFQTQPEIINRFVGDRFEGFEIFPDKLDNLNGCPLKVTTRDTPPFVINATNRRYPKLKATGFEMLTVNAISRAMNFTLDIDWIPYDRNQSADIRLLDKLRKHETNITMGFFRQSEERNQIATPTIETFYVPLMAVTIRKKVSHESIDVMTYPFDNITWILMFVVYITIGLMSVYHTKNIQKGIFQTFAIIIGATIRDNTKTTSTRLRIMTTLLSSMVLRTLYQSLLFYVFQSNFYVITPYSLMALATEGYKIVATDLTQQFLLDIPEIANKTLPLIVTNSSSEMSPFRYMEFHRNESLVSITIIEFALRYVYDELAYGSALRALPVIIKDQHIGFYLTKHSYLIDHFNDYIDRLHQSGLMNKWREWSNSYIQVSRKRVSSSNYDSAFIINLSHFSGFLYLMLFLHSTSIVLFVMELLSQKILWLQKLL